MGARTNIQFVSHETTLNVYLHWGGDEAAQVAVAAAQSDEAKSRWDDPGYFTAIVVKALLDEFQSGGTGSGLYFGPNGPGEAFAEEEYTTFVFDVEKQTWTYGRMGGAYADLAVLTGFWGLTGVWGSEQG